MIKTLIANGQKFEAEQIIKSADSIIGYIGGQEVFAFKGVSAFTGYEPGTGETWDSLAGIVPKTFDELKVEKVAELNAACRRTIEAGFLYDGRLFKSAVDPDQTNIALAGLQFVTDPSTVIPWETADNQVVFLTAETFPLFAGAFGQHKMAQQTKVSGLKAQAQEATKPEQLSTILW